MGFVVNLIQLTDDQLCEITSALLNTHRDELRLKILEGRLTPDFGTCTKFFGDTQEAELEVYTVAAEGLAFVRDGECEIDACGIVSKGDDIGAYVMAWVWVDDSDLDEDDKTLEMKIKGLAKECDIDVNGDDLMAEIEGYLEITNTYPELQERYDKARFEFDN
jgi:hypothetical protein